MKKLQTFSLTIRTRLMFDEASLAISISVHPFSNNLANKKTYLETFSSPSVIILKLKENIQNDSQTTI
jgi:hypothetical protein